MEPLTSAERRYLAALAHEFKPVSQIGQAGLTDAVVDSAEKALRARELVKIRIHTNCELDRREVAEDLARRCRAEIVRIVGRTFLLFRRRKKTSKIEFPPDVAQRADRQRESRNAEPRMPE